MLKQNNKRYKLVSALIFNALLFYLLYEWLIHHVHFYLLIHYITAVSSSSIILVMMTYIGILMLYGIRLSLLLQHHFTPSFNIICVGYGINNIMPFRLGDVLRIYIAKRIHGIQVVQMIAATIIERCLDLSLLLVFGLVLLSFSDTAAQIGIAYLFYILLGFAFAALLLYRYLIVKNSFLKRWICHIPHFEDLLLSVKQCLAKQCSYKLFIVSAMIWMSILSCYYYFFHHNLPNAHITWVSAILLCFMTTLSFAVPYSFAGIGIFESAIVYYLMTFLHIAATKALAIALVLHFTVATPQIIAMFIVLILKYKQYCQPLLSSSSEPLQRSDFLSK